MRAYDTGTAKNAAKRRILSHVFDTLGDMLDACALPADPCQHRGHAEHLQRTATGDAWTYDTLKDAATYERTLREGWTDALPRIDKIAAQVSGSMATPLDMRRKMAKGAQGDEYDLHAARGGKMDRAWTARRRAVAKAPAPIRILTGVVFNAGASGDAFFWRGAVALALASALKRKGYRVAVSGVGILVGCFSSGDGSYVARFDALRYGEPLDTAKLASVLCTPATLRHVLFRTALLLPQCIGGGYGHEPWGDDVEAHVVGSGAFPLRNEERLIIPSHLADERRASQWLKDTSARFA